MSPPLFPGPCSIARWLLAQRGMVMETACNMARLQREFILGRLSPPLFSQAMLHHTVAPGAACSGYDRPPQGQETTNAALTAEPCYCESNASYVHPSLRMSTHVVEFPKMGLVVQMSDEE